MNPLFLIGTLALLAFLYWAAYMSARALKNKTVEINGNLFLSVPEFIFKLLMLGFCFGLANSLDVVRLDKLIGWPPKQPIADLVIGLTVGFVMVFAINILSTVAIRIWGKSIYSPQFAKSLVPRNQIEWVLIIPPLLLAVALEEMLFRALLIGGFSLIVNPWAMAVAGSIIFGLMHSPQGILGIILVGLVGMLFGAIFIITNSLFIIIVAHFTINYLQLMRTKEDIAWYERLQDSPSRPPRAISKAETEPETGTEIETEVKPVVLTNTASPTDSE